MFLTHPMLTVAITCVLAQVTTATAPETAAQLRARAFELAYNLDHDEAMVLFARAIAAAPDEPAGYRAMAAVTWLNLVFRRGAITSDAYLGSLTKPHMAVKEVPAAQKTLFHDCISRALTLASARIRANPGDADAHYQAGATIGLLASYTAVIDGEPLKAFRAALRAYNEHETVMRLDPRRRDPHLIVGTYRYVVAALSMPARWMAYLMGFGGGRETGIGMIDEAAAFRSDVQTNARFAQILIYNRERRFTDALDVIAELQRLYPRNRLLWLEAGSTALRAGDAARAEAALNEGMARLRQDTRPRAFGEEALWLHKRGVARARLGRTAEATADFEAALGAVATDWVRGRSHLELGKLAGSTATARDAYARAAALCEADNDPICALEARNLLRVRAEPRKP